MESIKVHLGERSYPIYFGSGTLKDFGKTYKSFFKSKKVIVVTNPTVCRLYSKVISDSLQKEGFEVNRIDVPDGEEYKTLTWASMLFDKLIALKAGLAEVIKYGVIRDPKLFKYIEDNVDILTQNSKLKTQNSALLHIVKRSCAIKASVVEADEREAGLRAILNFGHTVGHAVEALTKYKEYTHGEAVAIGMVCASELSHRAGVCNKSVVERVRNVIKKAGLPTEGPDFPRKSFLKAMEIDKKGVGGG